MHNSGWVPAGRRLWNIRTEAYVKGVVAFANDKRILGWDVWNEPTIPTTAAMPVEPRNKVELVLELLPSFEWAREVRVSPAHEGV